MESISLLTDLEQLPADRSSSRLSHQEQVRTLHETGLVFGATEATAAVSFAMWGLFDAVNVDDGLARAYAEQYSGLATEHSLYEHWLEVTERGPDSANGFLSGLKGKVAEFEIVDVLESSGYSNVHLAESATQPGWDISAVDQGGVEVFWQVKTGGIERAGEIQALMLDDPELHFAVTSEIYSRIADNSPELLGQMLDIGTDFELVAGISDGMDTLVSNLGIDVPDGVTDILPYAAAIMAGVRLVYGALQTERQFRHIDRTERNKVHVIQALTAMSRIGVTMVFSIAGGSAGAAGGSMVPLVGNLVGGVGGMVGGAVMGSYLNQHLQPHVLELALDMTGLTHDDVFYYKNKMAIDGAAYEFQANTDELRLQLAQPWLPHTTASH